MIFVLERNVFKVLVCDMCGGVEGDFDRENSGIYWGIHKERLKIQNFGLVS